MSHDELSNLVDRVNEVNIDKEQNGQLVTKIPTSILINNGVDNHLNELRKVYIPYKILSECSVEFQPVAD